MGLKKPKEIRVKIGTMLTITILTLIFSIFVVGYVGYIWKTPDFRADTNDKALFQSAHEYIHGNIINKNFYVGIKSNYDESNVARSSSIIAGKILAMLFLVFVAFWVVIILIRTIIFFSHGKKFLPFTIPLLLGWLLNTAIVCMWIFFTKFKADEKFSGFMKKWSILIFDIVLVVTIIIAVAAKIHAKVLTEINENKFEKTMSVDMDGKGGGSSKKPYYI